MPPTIRASVQATPILHALAGLRAPIQGRPYEPVLTGDPFASLKRLFPPYATHVSRVRSAFPEKHPRLAEALARPGGESFVDALAAQHALGCYAPRLPQVERWLVGLDRD